jgi:putative inorganic carbon (hco3(-)) transporter
MDTLATNLKRWWWEQRQQNTPAMVALAAAALAVAYFISQLSSPGLAAVVAIAPVGLLVALLCIRFPLFAIGSAMAIAVIFPTILRMMMQVLPLGTGIDLVIYLGALGVLLRQMRQANAQSWRAFRNPIFLAYVAVVGYILLQMANPDLTTRGSYFLYLRRFFTVFLTVVIVLVEFKQLRFLIHFLKIWFAIATVCAIYGCIQEWFGLMPFERHWLSVDKHSFGLIFIMGRFRIFSLMPDPTSFGIMMSITALFGLMLIVGRGLSRATKIAIGISIVPMLLATAYSGTRTAYAIIPGGLVLYIMMTLYRKSTYLIAAGLGLAFLFILVAPIYHPVVIRIRSTVQGGEDASMNVRNVNRRAIQPYIYSHPFGGGITMAGGVGAHNGGHPLAPFPPDSGFLQTAVEQGWIGLILQCSFYAIVLGYGITYYYRCRNSFIRTLYLGFLVSFFALVLAQYGQAAEQVPTSLFLYSGLAFLIRLKDLDPAEAARLAANGEPS